MIAPIYVDFKLSDWLGKQPNKLQRMMDEKWTLALNDVFTDLFRIWQGGPSKVLSKKNFSSSGRMPSRDKSLRDLYIFGKNSQKSQSLGSLADLKDFDKILKKI